jgi:hypothetical protein
MTLLQTTKNKSFDMASFGSIVVFTGLMIIYFLSILAFGQVPHSTAYNNSGSNTSESDNSSAIWSDSNLTATNKTTLANKIYMKSMLTKISNPTHKTVLSIDKVDKFGILKIYPTVAGGREWYLNMSNPRNDSMFSIGSDQNITKQNDGSWRITNPEVRMNVTTPPNYKQWKNVEITGYVKVISIKERHKDLPEDIAWFARGGAHNEDARCNGTALIGGIHLDGSAGWKKEIWFTGGYTDELAKTKPTGSILNRWIGWKIVMYNIDNNTAVKMESYLDNNNTNHWVKVTNLTDNGGWYADTSDKKFYSAKCGKPKDYIMTNSGPDVFFRSDNMILDFKNLSAREIQAYPGSF